MPFGENVIKVAKATKNLILKENFMIHSDTTNCKNIYVSKAEHKTLIARFSFCVSSVSLCKRLFYFIIILQKMNEHFFSQSVNAFF
jgi:hypothetical protein